MQETLWMREMFDSIPAKYALLNKVLTFGQDNSWRDSILKIIKAKKALRILDICTGTGDLALKIAKNFPLADVCAMDFSKKMLEAASEKAGELGIQNITFKEGNCASIPFEHLYFDYVTISFGFRNLSISSENLKSALREVCRVLKEGSYFIILETSQPENLFIRKAFHFYVKIIVPIIGAFISRNKIAYSYLGASIVKFFDGKSLDSFLSSEGFKQESTVPFMLGMVRLSVFKKDK